MRFASFARPENDDSSAALSVYDLRIRDLVRLGRTVYIRWGGRCIGRNGCEIATWGGFWPDGNGLLLLGAEKGTRPGVGLGNEIIFLVQRRLRGRLEFSSS